MPEIETEEEPIDHDASESPEIDEKSLPGYKVDYSRVTTAVVRANSRLYQVDPRMLEKYKADHILIDGHLAFVDIDKKKVRPYLLAMLSQYEMLPELKLLNRIFFAVLVVGVFVLFAAFKPGD